MAVLNSAALFFTPGRSLHITLQLLQHASVPAHLYTDHARQNTPHAYAPCCSVHTLSSRCAHRYQPHQPVDGQCGRAHGHRWRSRLYTRGGHGDLYVHLDGKDKTNAHTHVSMLRLGNLRTSLHCTVGPRSSTRVCVCMCLCAAQMASFKAIIKKHRVLKILERLKQNTSDDTDKETSRPA